jgi:hypothetical protein
VDSDNYWHGWHWMASQLQAWEAAATGLELQRAQERRNPDLAEDAAYLDAIVCVRKAEMAQKSGHASEAASLVQNAINLLRDAAPDQQVDFDRWMTLADHVLPLAPQSLPALLMACEQQLAALENPRPRKPSRRIARSRSCGCRPRPALRPVSWRRRCSWPLRDTSD